MVLISFFFLLFRKEAAPIIIIFRQRSQLEEDMHTHIHPTHPLRCPQQPQPLSDFRKAGGTYLDPGSAAANFLSVFCAVHFL